MLRSAGLGMRLITASPISVESPLQGLRVVELQSMGPVPFVGMLLASLGANVARVVSPTKGGLFQFPGKGKNDLVNNDKEVVPIDLKSAAGSSELHSLLVEADIFLDGFRPGVLERLGFGPEELSRYPRLLIGRLSGWGKRGSLSARAGHDINYLALSGVLQSVGTDEQPVPPLNLIADYGGGAMHLLVGLLVGLVRRSATGKGGLVESSILAGTVGLTPTFHGLIADGIWKMRREANWLDGGAPFYRAYRTLDGRHMAVGALEPKFFLNLLGVLGLSGRFSQKDQYEESEWAGMREAFAEVFTTRTMAEWEDVCTPIDCCVTPVLTFAEAARHPHNVANGLFEPDQDFAPVSPLKGMLSERPEN